MENLLKNVKFRLRSAQLFIILPFQLCFFYGQEMEAQKRIVIDVGHGGKDSGAIGLNGIKEKDIVLNIALEILRLNDRLETPLDIYMTRYGDTLVSLSDRSKLAKTLNVDLFVSLHCNHSDDPRARGIEIYVGQNYSEYAKESVWSAYRLQKRIRKQLGFESRGVKFSNFQVLRETLGHFPSVLMELGFLSNGDESGYLLDNGNIKALAMAILMGLLHCSGY